MIQQYVFLTYLEVNIKSIQIKRSFQQYNEYIQIEVKTNPFKSKLKTITYEFKNVN